MMRSISASNELSSCGVNPEIPRHSLFLEAVPRFKELSK
jgi:hypothetical protein